MKWPKRIIFFVAVGIVSFIIMTVFFFNQELNRPKLPSIGQVQRFELTDETGHAFDSRVLLGNVWVANFFFTTCSDICPMMSKNMASLARSYEILNDVKFISFTVNPEQDTPGVLKNYAKRYKAKNGKWIFLTGNRTKITDIAVNSFKVGSITEPIFHSANFCLVDRRGIIRGYYEGMNTEAINKLFKDISILLKDR